VVAAGVVFRRIGFGFAIVWVDFWLVPFRCCCCCCFCGCFGCGVVGWAAVVRDTGRCESFLFLTVREVALALVAVVVAVVVAADVAVDDAVAVCRFKFFCCCWIVSRLIVSDM
jgi:hypothetical protein